MVTRRTGVLSLFSAMAMAACFAMGGASARAGEGKKNVLCTVFPVYQITRNVARGRAGVTVKLMLPGQLGCPHDYALTPQDMQKLARADVLVVNGLGLEEFLGAPVKRANANLILIESSAGIQGTLQYGDEGGCKACDHEEQDDHKDHKEEGHDHHGGANPHLFASPRMAAKVAMNIAAGLSKADPAGAGLYFGNAQAYGQKLNKLADEMAALGKRLKNNRIVQPHGIFDYLARDMGLEIVGVVQAHGQEPSAAEMIELAKTIRAKKAGAIFTEPQYPAKAGRILAKETGVKVGVLDPVAGGPDHAPMDYYETVMRKNMQALKEILGVQ